MKRYIVGIGEALWDVLPEGAKLGGAPANFAFHAGQFGFPAVAVSALGDDKLGHDAMAEFDAKHLEDEMAIVDYPTGTVDVTLDAAGVPSYEIKTGVAWDNIVLTKRMKQISAHAQAVCWGSLAQRSPVSHKSIVEFVKSTPDDCLKIFDINLRQHFYTREVIEQSLKLCDILKINDDELVIVTELLGLSGADEAEKCRDLLSRYSEYGIKMVVLTCGINGSYVFTRDEQSFCDTPKVEVADTVGAGDSFTGTFVASLLSGKTMREAHNRAVKVSAYVCTQNGAMPQLPKELIG